MLDSKTDYEMTALASETSLKNDTGAIKPIMLPDPEIIVFTDEHGDPMGGGANVQECREMAAWPYSSRQYYIPYSPSTKSLSERGKDEATGAWPLQEYIEDMILLEKSPQDIVIPPPVYDGSKELWIFKHLRQILLELHTLVIRMKDEGDCNAKTCPQMVIKESTFLCAGHRKPSKCSAYDYCCHTLDGAVAVLNSEKQFPDHSNIDEQAMPILSTLMRRLYRVFAHAAFHHPLVFVKCEDAIQTCQRFHFLCIHYEIMSPEMLIIPKKMFEKDNDDDDKKGP